MEDPMAEPAYMGAAPVEPWRWSPWPAAGQWRDPGYVSSCLLLVGSALYTLVVALALPGSAMPDKDEDHYWLWYLVSSTPELVGSVCFTAASAILLVEVQDAPFKPKPWSLGWHVVFWNLMGGVGFAVSAAFTYLAYPAECCQKWGTVFNLYWASVAFLLGSYLQMVEVLNPHRPPAHTRLTLSALTNVRFW